MPVHIGKKRTAAKAIAAVLDYVKNPDKTDGYQLVTSYQCNSQIADAEFLLARKNYFNITGRSHDRDVIAYHFRQSFKPGEIEAEEANRIGYEFASRFLKGEHAFIVCTHVDRLHIHNHVIWNATALDCTRKFRNFWGSARAVRLLSDTICLEHGKSIIEEPDSNHTSYGHWLGADRKLSHKEQLRELVDRILQQQPADTEDILRLLREAGCECTQRGRSITVKAAGWKRGIRLDSLGAEYREEVLPARTKATGKIDLLVDIDAKLREGKGGGYRQWASVFNAKQTAATINYLREHRLRDRSQLEEKVDEAKEKYVAVSLRIKALEARMNEITKLKEQIINYRKTKAVFDAYKSSGYSKKYLAKHEAEILLHRTAKKTFNELALKTLPSVKSLQEEYGECLQEKRALFGKYKKARDEMRQLLTIKANVDHIFQASSDAEKKEQEQGFHSAR